MNIDLKSLAVKDELNADIWNSNNQLKPEVRMKLIKIAEDFFDDLDIPWATLEDVRFTGSLANYNWSKHSDIDLHLIVDHSLVGKAEDLIEPYFMARKNIWNEQHDILINDFEVEVYIEEPEAKHVSTGIYSVVLDEWIIKPKKSNPNIDKNSIKHKTKVIAKLINDLIEDNMDKENYPIVVKFSELLSDKLKKMRLCGLDKGGEYSVENLSYKLLRRSGHLQKLWDAKLEAYDKMMSI